MSQNDIVLQSFLSSLEIKIKEIQTMSKYLFSYAFLEQMEVGSNLDINFIFLSIKKGGKDFLKNF